MKIYQLITLMMLSAGIATAEISQTEEEIHLGVNKTLMPPAHFNSDISWVTDGNRERVIADLLARANDKYEGRYVDEGLVRVGHVDTIKKIINQVLHNGDQGDILFQATSVEALHYFVPLVYEGEKKMPKLTGCVLYQSARHIGVCLMLSRIQQSDRFPEATRRWATLMGENAYKNAENEQWVNLLKQWWERNQTAILEKRYHDAKWLPLHEGKPRYLNDADLAEQESVLAEYWRRARTGQLFQDSPTTSSSTSVASVAATTTSVTASTSPWPFYSTLAAGLLIVAGILRWGIVVRRSRNVSSKP